MAFQQQHGYANVYNPYNNKSPPNTVQEYKPGFSSYAHSTPDDSSFHNAPLTEVKRSRRSSFKSKLCLIFSFLIGILWIGPAVYLIYINVAGQIIGASAWCPGGHCSVISYYNTPNVTTASRAVQTDENDHDLLGALQFAAKGMEVWFVGIAASLVYIVSRMIAKRPGGMPVGYLLTHLEFGDLRAIFDLNLYTSAINRRTSNRLGDKQHVRILYLFVFLVVMMCIVGNLMGPSVAVMMIPSLNWVPTTPLTIGRFQGVLSDAPPTMGWHDIIPGCNTTQLEDAEYDCNEDFYIDNTDSLVEAAVAFVSQNATNRASTGAIYAPTLEKTLPFSFNFSQTSTDNKTNSKVWAPNRQVIRALAQDFDDLADVVLGQNTSGPYAEYNSSLGLQLQREGPILGMDFDTGLYNRSVMDLGDNKFVHCMYAAGWADDTWYTRCHSRGTGWNTSNSEANFTISEDDVDADVNANRLFFKTYWSDRVGWINDNSSEFNACYDEQQTFDGDMNITTRAACDWDAIFARPMPQVLIDAGYPDFPGGQLITEWTLTETSNVTAFVTNFVPVQAVATYNVDVTEIFPNMQEVQVPNIPKEDQFTPIILHADWVLLGFSMQQGNNMPDIRPTGLEPKLALEQIIPAWANVSHVLTDYEDLEYSKMAYVGLSTGLQTLSMVTYAVEETSDTRTSDTRRPILRRNLRRQVWKFGLSSRTAHLGVVVLCLGVVTVVLRSVLLLVAGSRNPSTMELVQSSLEHCHRGEFGSTGSEREAAKVRYRVLKAEEPGEGERLYFQPAT